MPNYANKAKLKILEVFSLMSSHPWSTHTQVLHSRTWVQER